LSHAHPRRQRVCRDPVRPQPLRHHLRTERLRVRRHLSSITRPTSWCFRTSGNYADTGGAGARLTLTINW